MDCRTTPEKSTNKFLFSRLLPAAAILFFMSACATEAPQTAVAVSNTPLVKPVSPEKPIIIRIALAYISRQGLNDKFDLESAEIVKRTWEAYYVEVKQYPEEGKKQKTSIVKVYTEDGFPEWERW